MLNGDAHHLKTGVVSYALAVVGFERPERQRIAEWGPLIIGFSVERDSFPVFSYF